jgi:glycosyltransferase involved in cell wall biosynthesis
MVLRRMRALRYHCASTAMALSPPTAAVPPGSPLRAVEPAGGLAGEVRIARADLVMTTSERTLSSAAPRIAGNTSLIHFLHTAPDIAFTSEPFLRRFPAITRIVVPAGCDPGWFAARSGLRPEQVVAVDDFTLPRESLLGTARAKVIVAAGRLPEDSAVLDLVEGFRQALPHLPGWQLRIAGEGPKLADLREFVDRYELAPRVLVLGARHDLARHYLDAGLVVRIETFDSNGLSVLEGLAAGVPVLGSDSVPAVRRHVRHAENGWVLDRTDPAAIAEALVALSDPDRRADLAAEARAARAGLLTLAGERALRDLVEDTTAGSDRRAS